MLPVVLEKLLILQARDRRRIELEAHLKAVPGEVAAVEKKISTERGAIETAKLEWQQLEAKKKLLETEIGAAEQKCAKYKTQQLEVRKNDEYRALGHEIETTEAQIGKLEEEELGILYAIETAKAKFAAAEAELKANISGHETKIRVLKEREGVLVAELATARAEVTDARTPLTEPVLRLYDRIAVRQMPVCVPLRGGKCGGCHLKVSSDVESGARGKGDVTSALPTCDQCGRIVWWESAL
ncbi:MAG: hypothetical protein KBA71_16160 [Opitutaceae bacterium]|jgi:predicted  nucleic acid-binding Zn-ribbon protein|nr:hypothetical protein [Opitutaceae bacterium]